MAGPSGRPAASRPSDRAASTAGRPAAAGSARRAGARSRPRAAAAPDPRDRVARRRARGAQGRLQVPQLVASLGRRHGAGGVHGAGVPAPQSHGRRGGRAAPATGLETEPGSRRCSRRHPTTAVRRVVHRARRSSRCRTTGPDHALRGPLIARLLELDVSRRIADLKAGCSASTAPNRPDVPTSVSPSCSPSRPTAATCASGSRAAARPEPCVPRQRPPGRAAGGRSR